MTYVVRPPMSNTEIAVELRKAADELKAERLAVEADRAAILADPFTGNTPGRSLFYVRATATPIGRVDVDLGMTDAKGRAIGYRIRYSRLTFKPRTEEDRNARYPGGSLYPAEALCRMFQADTVATRDGERYGASTKSLTASTPAKLEALVEARLEGARKRYARLERDRRESARIEKNDRQRRAMHDRGLANARRDGDCE